PERKAVDPPRFPSPSPSRARSCCTLPGGKPRPTTPWPLAVGSWKRSTPHRQPLREDVRQPRAHDLRLRGADVVLDAHERQRACHGVEEAEGGARVAVARLPDGAAVDEVSRVAVGGNGDLRRAQVTDAARLAREMERRDDVRVPEEAERPPRDVQ